MGLIDRFRRRRPTQGDRPEIRAEIGPAQRGEGDSGPLLGPDGVPALHLIPCRGGGGEVALQLCEDRTGRLVSPRDSRLPSAGVHISQLRGAAFHRLACTAGDFHPGARVHLRREPANEFDPDAVAVYDGTGRYLAAYVNNQKARLLSRLIDSGQPLEAVSIQGTGPGYPCDQVAVLAASPQVLQRFLEPRPADLPAPVTDARLDFGGRPRDDPNRVRRSEAR